MECLLVSFIPALPSFLFCVQNSLNYRSDFYRIGRFVVIPLMLKNPKIYSLFLKDICDVAETVQVTCSMTSIAMKIFRLTM